MLHLTLSHTPHSSDCLDNFDTTSTNYRVASFLKMNTCRQCSMKGLSPYKLVYLCEDIIAKESKVGQVPVRCYEGLTDTSTLFMRRAALHHDALEYN